MSVRECRGFAARAGWRIGEPGEPDLCPRGKARADDDSGVDLDLVLPPNSGA